jgi:hypothetical protein
LASATSAISGGIVDDGTLLFAQGTNGSFAGSISGIGIRRLCQAEHWGTEFRPANSMAAALAGHSALFVLKRCGPARRLREEPGGGQVALRSAPQALS